MEAGNFTMLKRMFYIQDSNVFRLSITKKTDSSGLPPITTASHKFSKPLMDRGTRMNGFIRRAPTWLQSLMTGKCVARYTEQQTERNEHKKQQHEEQKYQEQPTTISQQH